ncbi:MAG: hypothetical protein QM754_03205 [Tepidisphaeraceae bacterium]
MFLACGGGSAVFVLGVGLLCVALRRLEALARTPMLDVILSLLTWIPWLVSYLAGGWAGLAGCVVGQFVALYGWCFVHELMHPVAKNGPRIVKFIDRHVGRWRNHLALWATLVVLPVFWLIRLATATIYWPLVWLLKFPKYRQAEWINVSRQKFDGLVGHDLVWCLYCDWMTGVYSLGAEMLRNVESFWCPIRYYDGKKCDNCKLDFPDIDNGWVKADGNMADVDQLMQDKYGQGQHAWFGHPVRLTRDGKPLVPSPGNPGEG